MKSILQKIKQPFELNFVFILLFSEHEEDELFKFGTNCPSVPQDTRFQDHMAL